MRFLILRGKYLNTKKNLLFLSDLQILANEICLAASFHVLVFLMPAIMKSHFFFVLSAMFSLHLSAQNLILNPGFESWQKTSKPTGWTTALGCLKDSSLVLSGDYSCRQTATSDSRELGQAIAVAEGKQYRISFWYRNETGETGNGCRIWSNWKDAGGNSLDDDVSLPLLHSGFLKSENWKQYYADVTAPATAAFFNLIIRTLPNSVTFWDDIKFEENVPTKISEGSADKLSIYPNPASNYLTISNINRLQLIEIQTLTGIKVGTYVIKGEERLMIPVSGLKNGIYIINMYSSTRRYSGRFIKTGL